MVETVVPTTAKNGTEFNGTDGNRLGRRLGHNTRQIPSHQLYQKISYENESNFALEYILGVGEDYCYGINPPYPREHGFVYFNTSNITGEMPDIAASGPCPLPLAVIGMMGPNQTNPTCPLLTSPRPPPVSCAFSVDTQIADQISKAMVEASTCKNVTWPNGTGIGNPCDTVSLSKLKSDTNVLHWNSLAALLPALCLAFMLAFG